jgi:hypothetical protein
VEARGGEGAGYWGEGGVEGWNVGRHNIVHYINSDRLALLLLSILYIVLSLDIKSP